MARFLIVNLNPTFQRTLMLPKIQQGEVNRALMSRFDISGKGVNATRVLKQLGADARLITHLGPGREALLERCNAEGLDIRWESSESHIRTCITLLDTTIQSTTELIEPTTSVDKNTVLRVRQLFEKEITNTEWLILTGTRTPGYPDNLFVDFCSMAHSYGVNIAADFRGKELLPCLNLGLHVVKINLVEFVNSFLPNSHATETDDTTAVDAVRKEMKRLSLCGCSFVVTRGKRDIFYAHKGVFNTCTLTKITPVNTIGSGDAFTAGLVYALANGLNLDNAVREGARCGTLNAGLLKPGSIQ